MAEEADPTPTVIFSINEETGNVVYERPSLSTTKFMLGPVDEAMHAMADFLAEHDFGDR